MKIQAILFGLFILFGCTETKVSKESKSYAPEQCIMQAIRDSTISKEDQIIGYQFLCEEKDTVRKFLFYEDNPWRHVGLPILPAVNPYISYSNSNQYESLLKRGFISFDLTKSTYQNVKDKFNITTNEQIGNLIPIHAYTVCRYTLYPSNVLLVNYILSINVATDTHSLENNQQIHIESQLKVLLSNGETAYHLISKEYACTGAILDSTHRFLFLRTLKPHPKDGITGIDIRNIQSDSILFKLEMDSSFIIAEPKLFGSYVAYEIYTFISANEDDGIRPYQILVFDITNTKMLERTYKKNDKFKFQKISNQNLIYMAAEGEMMNYLKYDTINIAEMEFISSPTQSHNTIK